MKPLFLLLSFSFVLLCFSCKSDSNTKDATPPPAAVEPIKIQDGPVSKEQFILLMNEKPNAPLIDVRTPQEFSEGYIEKAVNYDFYDGDFLNHMTALDKSKPVFIYCQSGGRSGKTYKMLKDMGFKEVYDLKDGYGEWK